MEAMVARHAQVEWVACGHIHRPIQVAWGGTIACTAPSTSHAQVALTLAETSGFDFGYALEPRAIQLYLRDPGYGFLSHISYVSGAYETYPSSNASRLRRGFNAATRSCVARNLTPRRPLPGCRHPPPGMVAEWLPSRTRHWSRRPTAAARASLWLLGAAHRQRYGRPLPRTKGWRQNNTPICIHCGSAQ